MRLVRDVPVGSPAWKRTYHRARNAAEGRNAAFEDWGLKRMPVYGDPRSRTTVSLADVWTNLTTLARLVRETTAATGNNCPCPSPNIRHQALRTLSRVAHYPLPVLQILPLTSHHSRSP